MASVKIGLVAAILALGAGAVTPASAEFFGCNDKPGRVLYSYTGAPRAYSARHTHDFAAQTRSRHAHATYAGAKRYSHERSRW